MGLFNQTNNPSLWVCICYSSIGLEYTTINIITSLKTYHPSPHHRHIALSCGGNVWMGCGQIISVLWTNHSSLQSMSHTQHHISNHHILSSFCMCVEWRRGTFGRLVHVYSIELENESFSHDLWNTYLCCMAISYICCQCTNLDTCYPPGIIWFVVCWPIHPHLHIAT